MALIFLLIMTILGVTAMTTSSLQEKMAGNLRDQFMAMESVESALRAGEQWLFDYRNRFGANNRPINLCPASNDPTDPEVWSSNCVGNIDSQTDTWWQTFAVAYDSLNLGLAHPIDEVAAQPRYIIEEFDKEQDSAGMPIDYKESYLDYYIVSAWSYGATQSARALAQNTFRLRF